MKALKWILIIVAVLGIVGYFGMSYAKKQTKKHSPEETITYTSGNLKLSVYYSRPYKNGRDIFGGLVPLNEVWRTGANEPTTFTTNETIFLGEAKIEPGTYSLWTIPQQTQWTVIINSEVPDWGAGFDGKAAHNPKYDVHKINVAVQDVKEPVEQLTIEFLYNVNLAISWDQSMIMIPIRFNA